MRSFLRRLRNAIRQRQLDADLAEEFEFHRAMKQRELEASGYAPTDAAFAARRAFGSAALAHDAARDVWIWPWLRSTVQDLRFAVRLLAKERWFTLAAASALALGIAATSTVFTFVNATLLKSVPVVNADRVVAIAMRDRTNQQLPVCYPDFDDWQRASKSFSAMTIMLQGAALTVSDENHLPEQYWGPYTSVNLFSLIGQRPVLGRDFTAEDDRPGAPAVVLLGYGLWQARYGGDPAVIGRTITVGSVRAAIVGVMPPDMKFPPNPNAELWMPLGQINTPRVEGRGIRSFQVIARLADGVSLAQARQEIATIGARLAQEYPDTNRDLVPEVVPYSERVNGPQVKTLYWSLMGASAFVLLIACINVSNLLLAKASRRAREMGLRAALGASRWRIVRQLLVESVLLASIGGLLSYPMSLAGIRFFDAATQDSGRPYYLHYTMDGTVFAFFAAVCLLTGVLFGLAPALHVSKTNLNDVLKEGGRSGSASARGRRWTAVLIVGLLASTLTLLAGAGFMMRSFVTMYTMHVGIDPSQLLAMQLPLPGRKYPTSDDRLAFLRQVDERLATVRAVDAAATTSAVPLGGGALARLTIDGRAVASDEHGPLVTMLSIGPRYFDTLRLHVVQGRDLTEADGPAGHENVTVNQRLASLHFAGENPVGRRIRLAQDPSVRTPAGAPAAWLTIVGVVPSVRQRNVREMDEDPVVYVPRQAMGAGNRATLLVRTRSDPGKITALLREEIRALDPDMPLFNIRTMTEDLTQQRSSSLVVGATFTLFAGIALVLSAVGLYATTAYAVTQRTQEIGVRMALGAQPWQVVWLILRGVLVQLTLGVTLGIAGAFAVGRVIQSLLVQTSASDPFTLGSTAALLIVTAIAACAWPTLRATRFDPLAALRYE